MPGRISVARLEKRAAQIRHDLEYEYDYFRVKDLREELQQIEKQIERRKKERCNR